MAKVLKKIVFISHITEEARLAKILKELIEDSFLGLIEVFVSSDEESILAGSRWLENITDSLKGCALELILCSPESVKRPWINFEAGAGWVRDIPVIPICHSGMEPNMLPIPLNMLQAVKASEISQLKLLLPVLSSALESKTPKIDLNDFVESVKEFEEDNMFWSKLNESFAQLELIIPNITSAIKVHDVVQISLPQDIVQQIEGILNRFLTPKNFLTLRRTGSSSITPNGFFMECEFIKGSHLSTLFQDKRFKI